MVTTGTAVAGATVITGTATMNGEKTAGGGTIMAVTVAGTTAKPMNAATAKAGATGTIVVADRVMDAATDTVVTITKYTSLNTKRSQLAPFFISDNL